MECKASNGQKKCTQIPSTSMQDSIPTLAPELITEIVLRLPVKSLLRFRSVSKSWFALISSSQFINAHLNLSDNNTHHMLLLGCNTGPKCKFKDFTLNSLFYDSVTEAFDLPCPIKDATKCMDIVGSCNGLIFLAHYSKYSFIWNPTTRKCMKLPDFRPRVKINYAIYGFGYDKFHDDYKVVAIFYNLDYIEVKVYRLKSDSWSSVDYCGEILNASGSSPKMRLNASGLFVNGKLHWDTITHGPIVRKGTNIISFDLADEKWEKMEKPSYGEGDNELCVGVLGSDLSVFFDYKGTHLGAWVMKEYGVKESWIKMFNIRYPNDQGLYPPFFMSNKGEILVVFRFTFMIYNPKDHSFRNPGVTIFDGCYGADIYIESLVCPFSTKERTPQKKELRSKRSSNQ